ncbi:MAG: hypothetical protein MUO18_03490, partial [Methanomassiliicoccales archaeon]|nr:hypothetical protein [Methanomassiliicoccales archaeon]
MGFPSAGNQWFAMIEASSFDILKIHEEFEMILHFPHSFSFPLDHTCACFLIVNGIGCIEKRIFPFFLLIRNLDFDLLDESVMHSESPLKIYYVIRLLIV